MPYTVLTGGIGVCELDGYGPITAAQARAILARTPTGTPTSAGIGGREVNQGNNNGSARRPGGDGRAGRRPDSPRGADSRPAAPRDSAQKPNKPRGGGAAVGDGGLLVQRLVCDPLDGSLLDATRIAGYVPPEWLAEQIRIRDRTCIAPGCRQPAARTEIDHRIPYQAGGATSADNLNLLCKHHHRAKDGGGWTLTRTADGTYHWTSPLGRTHTREPETWWQPTETTGDRPADSIDQSVAANDGGTDQSDSAVGERNLDEASGPATTPRVNTPPPDGPDTGTSPSTSISNDSASRPAPESGPPHPAAGALPDDPHIDDTPPF
nr:HNH endonuclease signature motif containing protein [Nakamurella aerolata]